MTATTSLGLLTNPGLMISWKTTWLEVANSGDII